MKKITALTILLFLISTLCSCTGGQAGSETTQDTGVDTGADTGIYRETEEESKNLPDTDVSTDGIIKD